MKIKKQLVKIITIGSIFIITALSFGGIISLQDDNIDSFWTVKKLNLSFIETSYAESYDKESYEKESGNYNQTTNSTSSVDNISTPVVELPIDSLFITQKEYKLTNEEKEKVKKVFNKFNVIINNKKYNDTGKLNLYSKLNTLVNDKILLLESVKLNIKNESIVREYEKKIGFFDELSNLVQGQILVYIDSFDLDLNLESEAQVNNTPVNIPNQPTQPVQSNQTAQAEAAQKAAQAQAADAARLAAQRAAQAEAARIIAQKAAQAQAAEEARIAAEKAAQVDTSTSAS